MRVPARGILPSCYRCRSAPLNLRRCRSDSARRQPKPRLSRTRTHRACWPASWILRDGDPPSVSSSGRQPRSSNTLLHLTAPSDCSICPGRKPWSWELIPPAARQMNTPSFPGLPPGSLLMLRARSVEGSNDELTLVQPLSPLPVPAPGPGPGWTAN